MELAGIITSERVTDEQEAGGMMNDSYGNSSLEHEPRYIPFIEQMPAAGAVLLIVMVFMVIAGTVGNTLVILSVTTTKKLRNSCNILIVNLAIADMSVSVFSNPFAIVGLLYGKNYFDNHWILCELIATSCVIACTCSLLTILTVSLNRYVAIVKNQYYDKIFTIPKTLAMAAILWIASCTVPIPNHFGWGSFIFDEKQLICNSDRMADYWYNIYFAVTAMVIPIGVVFCLYMGIFKHVAKARNAISSGKDSKGPNKNVKLAKSLFTIFIAFLVCWGPYAVGMLLDTNDTWPQGFHVIALQMAHFSSSGLNSFIYAVTQPPFRDAYIRILCCGRQVEFKKKKKVEETSAAGTAVTHS